MNNIAVLTGPLLAEILHITNPHCISVRLSTSKDRFCMLQESLMTVYCSDDRLQYSLQPGQYPVPGQSYAVRLPGAWYRGMVIHPKQGMTTFLVRLVDAGRIVECLTGQLYILSPQFLVENALSFLVHLSQMAREERSKRELVAYMEELVRDQDVVTLHRRAPPKLVEGHWSLPVEISWTELENPNPFLPAVKREVFMSQRLLQNNNNLVKNVSFELDDTIEDDDYKNIQVVAQHGRSSVLKNSSTNPSTNQKFAKYNNTSPQFAWMNPHLPGKRNFYARATHVDDSGQIYMHLQDQRYEFRGLRSKLSNQFLKSSPDCSLDTYHPNQEVIAQYVDTMWYRARFLAYVPDSECGQAYVLFVDWGNTSTVQTSQLRSMLVGQDIHILAFRAVLHNVLPSRLEWDPSTIDFMQDKVMYTKLGGRNQIKIKVESGLDRQPLLVSIKLYSPLDPGDSRSEVFKPWVDLSELLVQKRVARFASLEEVESPDQRRSRRSFDYGVGFIVTKRSKLGGEDIGEETEVKPGSCLQGIPSLDLACLHLEPGSVVGCKLAGVDRWDRVFIHLLTGEGENQNVFSCFTSLERCMQEMSRDMPPVIRPREGLLVALWRGKNSGGWCRAEIIQCEETGYLVRVVDLGLQEWISDSRLFRELPEQCLGVPIQAVALHLPLVGLEEEEDTLLAVMTECLLSVEGSSLNVVVTSCLGDLFGHLVDKENNQPVYRRLEKERLLRLL